MPSRRLIDPRSALHNIRPIVRRQYRFDDGMRLVPECEAMDIGDNSSNPAALAYLRNCRGFKHHIEGDTGTRRIVAASFAVTITDDLETLGQSADGGELYTANGGTIASGTIFEVRGTGDFSGGELLAAKGDYPRPYDQFSYVDASTVTYLGTIRVPAVRGYGDTSATEITAFKLSSLPPAKTMTLNISGNTITSVVSGSLNATDIGETIYLTTGATCTLLGANGDGTFTIAESVEASSMPASIGSNVTPHMRVSISGTTMTVEYSLEDLSAGDVGRSVYVLDDVFVIENVTGPTQAILTSSGNVSNKPAVLDSNVTPRVNTLSGVTKIYRTSGPEFTSSLEGAYFVWDDGVRDRIISVLDGSTLQVSDTAERSGVICKIEPDVYASAQHRSSGIWVIMAGQKLYYTSSVPHTGWIEIPLCGTVLPAAYISELREQGDGFILMNPNGFFKIVLSGNIWAYRLNEAAPSGAAGDVSLGAPEYRYRGIYTMTLLTGDTPLNSTRLDASIATLERESPPCLRDADLERDYSIIDSEWEIDAPGVSNGAYYAVCRYPSGARAFSHYTLWRTLNVSAAGVNAGNKENLFIYCNDIPVAKTLRVTIVDNTITDVINGAITDNDIGDTLYLNDGSTCTLVVDNGDGTYTVTGHTGTDTNIAAWFGSTSCITATISGTSMTVTAGRSLLAGDAGKLLFAYDSYFLIKRVLTATTAELAWAGTHSGPVVIDPAQRTVRDYSNDTLLAARRDDLSATGYYYLQTRFFAPMPNGSTYAIESGWLVSASVGEHVYYYCDLANDTSIGYYRVTRQYNNKLRAGITQITGYSGSIIIRCRNSTHRVLLATTQEVGDSSVGEQVTMLVDPVEVDAVIGVVSQFDTTRFPRGGEIVITSEPAVRFFDGNQYGEPYDAGRINKAITRRLDRPIVVSYIHRRGLVLWGRTDA